LSERIRQDGPNPVFTRLVCPAKELKRQVHPIRLHPRHLHALHALAEVGCKPTDCVTCRPIDINREKQTFRHNQNLETKI
jgi:hypothetical protein